MTGNKDIDIIRKANRIRVSRLKKLDKLERIDFFKTVSIKIADAEKFVVVIGHNEECEIGYHGCNKLETIGLLQIAITSIIDPVETIDDIDGDKPNEINL